MITRRSVWSDEEVQRRLGAFIPTADEVGHLQRTEAREGALFREIAEQGHYAGRVRPTNTRQGIYACTPGGRFLASVNTRRAADVLAMLDRALAAWDALPDEERAASVDASAGDAHRFRRHYPEDGLVLRVHSRDLARTSQPDDWRRGVGNRDYAWFRAAEVRSLVPAEIEAGATVDWPPDLAARVGRLSLVDNVRGQVPAFEPEDVRLAMVRTTVESIDDGVASVRFEGRFELVAAGAWPVDGHRDRDEPAAQERGVAVDLLGRGRFDVAADRFVEIEWVAAGDRWGATQYNGRADDRDRAGIGYVFMMAGAYERTEPAFFWEYGWR